MAAALKVAVEGACQVDRLFFPSLLPSPALPTGVVWCDFNFTFVVETVSGEEVLYFARRRWKSLVYETLQSITKGGVGVGCHSDFFSFFFSFSQSNVLAWTEDKNIPLFLWKTILSCFYAHHITIPRSWFQLWFTFFWVLFRFLFFSFLWFVLVLLGEFIPLFL